MSVVLLPVNIVLLLMLIWLSSSSDTASGASVGWLQVRDQTTCEALPDDVCAGRYGFTIKQDGTFIAGPSDRGKSVQSIIGVQELQQLRNLVTELLPTVANAPKNCSRGGVPGAKEELEVTTSTGDVISVYDLSEPPGIICFVGARERVDELEMYVRQLMTKYYPVPFAGNG